MPLIRHGLRRDTFPPQGEGFLAQPCKVFAMIPRDCYDYAVSLTLPPSTGEGGAQRRMRASFDFPPLSPYGDISPRSGGRQRRRNRLFVGEFDDRHVMTAVGQELL